MYDEQDMAKVPERRKNSWDDDENDDDGEMRLKKGLLNTETTKKADDSADIDRKIHETRVLMEQTHQLYQHYFNGIEKRPPIEKLKFLEFKTSELQSLKTNLTASRFKITQFLAQYTVMKELWARKLRK